MQVPFLQQTVLLRQGVKAARPTPQKQTQRSCQIEETKNYGPNERTEQNPDKELHATEVAKLSDVEFKTLVIRILKELTEHGNNIKEEMKVT